MKQRTGIEELSHFLGRIRTWPSYLKVEPTLDLTFFCTMVQKNYRENFCEKIYLNTVKQQIFMSD